MRTTKHLALLALLAPLAAGAQVSVPPTSETQASVQATGTQLDDVALWTASTADAGQNLLLVANEFSGLDLFTLDGAEVGLVAEGNVTGVDVHEGVSVGGTSQQLVLVANTTVNGLVPYVIDPGPTVRRLLPGTQALTVASFAPRTVALYRSALTGRLFAFTGNNVASAASVVQLEVTTDADGGVSGTPVRTITLQSPATGLVADDTQGLLFITERDHGLARISAEPTAGSTPDLVASVTNGTLTAPVGGVALYQGASSAGYVVVANTTTNTFAVFGRQPPNALVGSFRVVASADGGIDEVTAPRFLEITSRSLGTLFPNGLLVAHDPNNAPAENLKLVSWPDVANAFSPPLIIATQPQTDGGTPDAGQADAGTSLPPPVAGPTFPVDNSGDGCNCSTTALPGAVLAVLTALALARRRKD